ncbi:hypothetical protein Val02_93500 [Virgisporangium aliadipatigenens]|uniref:Uncharacterized protein n=1 Tax=Virgisporangium aliadipatigenens TaxID=741659 RepID=A0A8J4DW38_9ACTN|nr:hypothetical protein [Virgisporangium aliadipatigenens]GIJ52464.1 hypothetical protein Val02_93500 [Virgisporangium aliadipatigenens]
MGKVARNAQVARLLLDAAEYLDWKGWTSTDRELIDDKREQVSALGALEWAALGRLAVRAEFVLSTDLYRPLNDLLTLAVQELADVVEPQLHLEFSGSFRDLVAYWNDWIAKDVRNVQASLREAANNCDPHQVSSLEDPRDVAPTGEAP